MRDYLIAVIVLASLPVGIFRPYYGALVYAWISYMYPHLLAWSFVRTWPVAKFAGIGTLIGGCIRHDGDLAPLKERESKLMMALLGMFALSSTFAFYPGLAWTDCQNMAKIIIMALLTATLLSDQTRVRTFCLVVAFSLGYYGVKGGIFGFVTGGEQTVWGPEPSIIGANNALGLALNMCLPIFWYLSKDSQPLWLKRTLQVSFFLTIPSIMFTYSRASFLGLGAVILTIVLKGRRKALAVVLLLLIGMAAPTLLPEKWLNRQRSTFSFEEDRSAMSRIGTWDFSWRVALDRPFTGGGFQFYSMETFAHYFPEFIDEFGSYWNSHSIYFGVLAAHGFPGLIIFLSMIGCCLLSLQRIKSAVRERPDLEWLVNYSNMIQVSYVGFLVNGAFNNMEYFDLVYHWVGVVATLKVLTRKALAEVPAGVERAARQPELPASKVASSPVMAR